MDIIGITIDFLAFLARFAGWGGAIIILTLLVRLAMWPSSVTQQRSMRTMQMLQPKMKAIQERYKSDPQTMQRKMMEFYKENKFNPMAGCLPLLLQLPVFILLYTALMSPQFIEQAGKTNFLFINRLDATIKSNAGISNDGAFGVSQYDTFSSGKSVKIYLKNGDVLEDVKVSKPHKAISVQGNINPGEELDLKMNLDDINLKFSQLNEIEKAEVEVINNQTRETEKLDFTRSEHVLVTSVPTIVVKSAVHFDVIVLILLFAGSLWLSQKIMMASQKGTQQDPTQQAIQKSLGTMMPIMILVTFIFIPIPAGVLLYLVTSNVFQIAQTVIINKQLAQEDALKKAGLSRELDDVKGAKPIKAKEIKDVDDKSGKEE
ncbi:membrane protein insertase YidC/Oxa1 family [Candidatus Gastranaerophilus sp. (ex Termes propinquus)]|nr:membrane protein insertase YidC/Oxa1 family [Candidatus Gastranaerophilus sp. (ex Termes propinquus)]